MMVYSDVESKVSTASFSFLLPPPSIPIQHRSFDVAHIRQGLFSGGILDVTINGGTFVDVQGNYQSSDHERGGFSTFTEIHLSV